MEALALLCTLHADGPATLKRLRRAGCDSLEAFDAYEPSTLASLLSVPPAVARRLLKEARVLSARVEVGVFDDREEAPQAGAALETALGQGAPSEGGLDQRDKAVLGRVLDLWTKGPEGEGAAAVDQVIDDLARGVGPSSVPSSGAVPTETPGEVHMEHPTESMETEPAPTESAPNEPWPEDPGAHGSATVDYPLATPEVPTGMAPEQPLEHTSEMASSESPEETLAGAIEEAFVENSPTSPEPTAEYALTPGVVDGMDETLVQALRDANVYDLSALIEADPLALSLTLHVPYAQLRRMQFLARAAVPSPAEEAPRSWLLDEVDEVDEVDEAVPSTEPEALVEPYEPASYEGPEHTESVGRTEYSEYSEPIEDTHSPEHFEAHDDFVEPQVDAPPSATVVPTPLSFSPAGPEVRVERDWEGAVQTNESPLPSIPVPGYSPEVEPTPDPEPQYQEPAPEMREPVMPESEITAPEIAEPGIPETAVTEPEITVPEITEPEMAEPMTPESIMEERVMPAPEMRQPVIPEPVYPEPVYPEPVTPEPEMHQPVVPEPETRQPVIPAPMPYEPEPQEPEAVRKFWEPRVAPDESCTYGTPWPVSGGLEPAVGLDPSERLPATDPKAESERRAGDGPLSWNFDLLGPKAQGPQKGKAKDAGNWAPDTREDDGVGGPFA